MHLTIPTELWEEESIHCSWEPNDDYSGGILADDHGTEMCFSGYALRLYRDLWGTMAPLHARWAWLVSISIVLPLVRRGAIPTGQLPLVAASTLASYKWPCARRLSTVATQSTSYLWPTLKWELLMYISCECGGLKDTFYMYTCEHRKFPSSGRVRGQDSFQVLDCSVVCRGICIYLIYSDSICILVLLFRPVSSTSWFKYSYPIGPPVGSALLQVPLQLPSTGWRLCNAGQQMLPFLFIAGLFLANAVHGTTHNKQSLSFTSKLFASQRKQEIHTW